MSIRLKRVREAASPDDGCRILVDRLWPRGVSRTGAAVDLWAKEIAPTTELRKWFGHDPEKWEEFRRRYLSELAAADADAVEPVRAAVAAGRVTLVFDARDEAHNNAVVLREFLESKRRAPRGAA